MRVWCAFGYMYTGCTFGCMYTQCTFGCMYMNLPINSNSSDAGLVYIWPYVRCVYIGPVCVAAKTWSAEDKDKRRKFSCTRCAVPCAGCAMDEAHRKVRATSASTFFSAISWRMDERRQGRAARQGRKAGPQGRAARQTGDFDTKYLTRDSV